LSLCYTALQRHYFNWNSKFNSTQISSQTNQSTPFNSALAIAGSIEEQIAEPFEAIGVAVAFWSFSAKGKGLGLRG
jgi:hypothetical protein